MRLSFKKTSDGLVDQPMVSSLSKSSQCSRQCSSVVMPTCRDIRQGRQSPLRLNRTIRARQPLQTGKPNCTRRESQTHEAGRPTAPDGQARHTKIERKLRQKGRPTRPVGKANRARRASQLHQTGKLTAPGGQANRTRRAGQPRQTGKPTAPEG